MRRHRDSAQDLCRALLRQGETFETSTIIAWRSGRKAPRSVASLDLLRRIEGRYLLPAGYFQAKLPTHRLSAPVNFIVHDLADVNKRLQLGRYFFTDIVRDGVALYETPGHPFAQPVTLDPAEALEEAQRYFESWLPSAARRLKISGIEMSEGTSEATWRKDAAFDLRQATERLYHCLLLVLTLYSPKSHKLNFLRSQAEQLEPSLIAAWPRATKPDQRAFELLRRAYVDARYSPHYKISTDELTWLGERVAVLQGLVNDACQARIVLLRAQI